MSKADYLLKYLSQDPKPEKKSKKRKRKAAQDGLIIADDDATGWEQDHSATADHDQDGPLTVSHRSAEFRKSKKNNWTTLSGAPATLPTSTTNNNNDDDASAADAILATAAAESRARQAEEDDEAPMLDDSGEKMASGARAGLTSGAQFAADMAAKRALEEGDGSGSMAGAKQETIYRDATGRIVNIAMKRAEARQKAAEKEAKAKAEADAARGDVQRAEREKRKGQLEDAKLMTVARYKDDEEMNEELRETERWNDPAAGFLTKKKEGKSVTGRPLYRGSAPPNRYGIRPGHMWDGVDRGIGFEGDWFKARNRVERLKDLDYAWQMDE